MTKFLNISVDNTLGGATPSDEVVSSQKAIKEYVDTHGGGGSVSTDGISINQNSSNELQTIGVINQNNSSQAIKVWTGTKAQYDAIVTKDPDTIYNVEDTTSPIISILDSLYPVGAIYIGTMSVCPLQTLGVGTWTLVSSGRVLQGVDTGQTVGTNISAGLPNITGTLNNYQNKTGQDATANSALYMGSSSSSLPVGATSAGYVGLYFDASRSSSIYGNSTTVQPPAYLVNIWERTA